MAKFTGIKVAVPLRLSRGRSQGALKLGRPLQPRRTPGRIVAVVREEVGIFLRADQKQGETVGEPPLGLRLRGGAVANLIRQLRVAGFALSEFSHSDSECHDRTPAGRLLRRGDSFGDIFLAGDRAHRGFEAFEIRAVEGAQRIESGIGKSGTHEIRDHEFFRTERHAGRCHHGVIPFDDGLLPLWSEILPQIAGLEHLDIAIEKHAVDRRVGTDLARVFDPPVAQLRVGEIVGLDRIAHEFAPAVVADQKRVGNGRERCIGSVAAVVHDDIAVIENLRGRIEALDRAGGCQRALFGRAGVRRAGGLLKGDERKSGQITQLLRRETGALADVHVEGHAVPREIREAFRDRHGARGVGRTQAGQRREQRRGEAGRIFSHRSPSCFAPAFRGAWLTKVGSTLVGSAGWFHGWWEEGMVSGWFDR